MHGGYMLVIFMDVEIWHWCYCQLSYEVKFKIHEPNIYSGIFV